MNNQRLVLRIETLQSKEKQQPEASSGGGGWGAGFFGGSSQAATQELAKVKQDLEVAQEELEAKMAENCKLRTLFVCLIDFTIQGFQWKFLMVGNFLL